MREERVFKILPQKVRHVLRQEDIEYEHLQEMKLRAGKPFLMIYQGEERRFRTRQGEAYIVSREDIREMMEYISNYSLYAYEAEMRQGFITIEGGHRIGMAGQAIIVDGKVRNLRHISSVNVRISHEVMGSADKVFPYITCHGQLYHTLVISPPRCGKTTLLRDMIRQISDGNAYIKGKSVGVVDERSEIGGCYMGIAQNHMGTRTDILDACPKAEGMIMLIRSMGPEVIAVDEIGASGDVRAIEYAMHCGCKMLATAHGRSFEELAGKPVFDKMIQAKRFERYILLGNQESVGEILGIYDENGASVRPGEKAGQS